LVQAKAGRLVERKVTGPLGDNVAAVYGILGDERTAVIEVAATCGLPLLSPMQRNLLFTTTYSVGELIMDAIDKGAGVAGGLGAAFSGFLNAHLQSGIELVLDSIKIDGHMQEADFVITGEGKVDGQTSMGKVPLGVAQLVQKHSIPVIPLSRRSNRRNL
jgi:glycerate kinase